MDFAKRMQEITSFRAVDLSNLAQEKRAKGFDVISMGIGEPDFTAPLSVVEALDKAAREGKSAYSEAAGIPELREAIAQYYNEHFHTHITSKQVIVTSGASAALAMTSLCFINPGDEILMPDPSYPPNMSFIRCAGGIPKQIPTTIEGRFQLTAQDIEANWSERTRGVLLASPGNPTGTSIEYEELKRIVQVVKKRGGLLIMDEIYLGLYYAQKPKSVLSIDDDVVVINSFSKYFNMTGWRLGWIVLPEQHVKEFEKLSSNFAICASSLAQRAALACFEPDTIKIYEDRRLKFKERLDYLVPALEALDIHVPVVPDGAFYIYADVSRYTEDSFKFAYELLDKANIVWVPGLDFGPTWAKKMVRISYATALDRLQEAMYRLEKIL
ncbi:pyridoxal phosphate-dependent aminotransferase [Basilea psittacipulmonis]|uniref:Aminotransferase n=1 Tax=Basilea psittacipulmonis DSM 24701 TaxID=1072685 RepID=A0A077DBP8_9BURK|nr:pyridoxal phosphate-dependent aminotransferase [Basilea psittacipulmonis]AIL32240.1 aminotransferase [Basilea psittacipulmonis DSM 24701]